MQAPQFEEAVARIISRDSRFDGQAYLFLKEALDFTVKRLLHDDQTRPRHVSGPELLEGFRDLALQEFGPMALTLLNEWGLQRTRDVGEMVFHLIDEQVFGKQDDDKLEDFDEVYEFAATFEQPFLPRRQLLHRD